MDECDQRRIRNCLFSIIRPSSLVSLDPPDQLQGIDEDSISQIFALAQWHHILHIVAERFNTWQLSMPAMARLASYNIGYPWDQYILYRKLESKVQYDNWRELVTELNALDVRYAYIKGYAVVPDNTLATVPWYSHDQDYLVDHDSLHDVEQALFRLGYQRGTIQRDGTFTPTSNRIADDPSSDYPGKHGEAYFRFDQHPRPSVVEVHWTLLLQWEPFDLHGTRDIIENHTIVDVSRSVKFYSLEAAIHFVFLCIHLYRHETELGDIRERSDGSLRSLVSIACFAESSVDRLPWDELVHICASLSATIPVDFVLRQIELCWPNLLPISSLGMSIAEYSVNAKAIRFGQATHTWDIVGAWKQHYIERIFDMKRWDQLIELENRLRINGIVRRIQSARSPGGIPIADSGE